MPISPDSIYFIDDMHASFAINNEGLAAIYAYHIDIDGIIDRYCDVNSEILLATQIHIDNNNAKKTIVSLRHLLDSSTQIKSLMQSVSRKAVKQSKSAEEILMTDPFATWLIKFSDSTKRVIKHLSSANIINDIMTEHNRYILESRQLITMTADITAAASYQNKRKHNRQSKNDTKKSRKALLRGITLFKSLFPNLNIDAFLIGEVILVEGARYDYCIRSKGDMVARTMNVNGIHVPYHITIKTKDGDTIGNGCTTFDNSPIVDQLISLLLHINDDEDNTLRNMNITNRTPEFEGQPELKAIKATTGDVSSELMVALGQISSVADIAPDNYLTSTKVALTNALSLPLGVINYFLNSDNRMCFDEYFDTISLDYQINGDTSSALERLNQDILELNQALTLEQRLSL